MNNVTLIGRLTRDPETRQTNEGLSITRFALAIDRPVKNNSGEKQADFPNIITFGKTADNCQRYLAKGRLIAVQGRIQTGSYTNKDGNKVYTTDVIAERVQFLEWGEQNKQSEQTQAQPQTQNNQAQPEQITGFASIDDSELPF